MIPDVNFGPLPRWMSPFALILVFFSASMDAQPDGKAHDVEQIQDWRELVGQLPRWSFSHDVAALALSPEADWVAYTVAPGHVVVWDVATGRATHRLDVAPFQGNSSRVFFAGDGRFLVVLNLRRFRVFDLSTDEWALDLATDSVSFNNFFVGTAGVVAFDGPRNLPGKLAVSVFDLAERREIALIDVRELEMGRPWAVALSPDHQRVATWHVIPDPYGPTDFRSRLGVWETETGLLVNAFDGPREVEIQGFGFDEQDRLWTAAYGIRRAWDPDSGRELRRFEIPQHGQITGDGRHWVVAQGSLFAVDPGNGDHHLLTGGLPTEIELAAVAGSSSTVATLDSARHRHLISLWDAQTGDRRAEIGPQVVPSRSVAFSPDNRYVASGSIDGVVRIWDAEEGYLEQEKPLARTIATLVFWDDRRLAAATEDSVLVWDLRTGELRILQELRPPLSKVQSRHRPLTQFSTFSSERLGLSDNGRLAYVRGPHSYLWAEDETPIPMPKNTAQPKARGTKGLKTWSLGESSIRGSTAETRLSSVDLSPDGEWMAVGDNRRGAVIRDLAKGRDLYRLHLDGTPFRRVRLHPDKQVVLVDAQLPFQNLKIFDLKSGQTRFEVSPDDFTNIGAFELSKDGRLLWVGDSHSGRLRTFDMKTGAELFATPSEPVLDSKLSVEALAPSPDGNRLAVAYDDGSIRLWRARDDGPKLEWFWLGGRGGNWLSCAPDGECRRRDDGTFIQRLGSQGRFEPLGRSNFDGKVGTRDPGLPDRSRKLFWTLSVVGLTLLIALFIRWQTRDRS